MIKKLYYVNLKLDQFFIIQLCGALHIVLYIDLVKEEGNI